MTRTCLVGVLQVGCDTPDEPRFGGAGGGSDLGAEDGGADEDRNDLTGCLMRAPLDT